MADKSGVSPDVLSLPKGGGAVRGLGTSFETDLNTGTGSFAVPIEVPAGPNAIRPRLELRYHSAAGNDHFGLGWTLGLLSIARKSDDRFPRYDDEDVVTLVGVEDLVPVGGNLFRPRVDTLFWHIERTDGSWLLKDKLGKMHRLGLSSQGRVEDLSGQRPKTAVWLLESMEDTSGNRVEYFYRSEGAQRYLETVRWGTYELRFLYSSRPDPVTNGRFGFLLSTELLCSAIELHVTTLEQSLARRWSFEYESSAAGHSLLSSVRHSGHDDDGQAVQAPPLRFEYSHLESPSLERLEGGTETLSFSDRHRELVDWDGDGLPDLVELGGGEARVWPNRGGGRWGKPRSIGRLPTPVAMSDPAVALADMEGNGTADLVVLTESLAGYYPLEPGGGFARPRLFREAPSHELGRPQARLVDLDGNGVADLLVTAESAFYLYYRDRASGWSPRPQRVPREVAPPVELGDPRVHVGDMNGDGLRDLVRIDGRGVVYWPYLGRGHWGEAVFLGAVDGVPRADPRRFLLVDIDGDGCDDVLYWDSGRVLTWLNRGGSGLGERKVVAGTPNVRPDEIRIADVKGDGTVGVLIGRVEGARRTGQLYLSLSGGKKPYLLTAIDNGVGLRTEISYRSSTEFAIRDRADKRPWRTFHPFPVPCVSEVTRTDAATGVVETARYRYHEGRYDGSARSFLGFSCVESDTLGDEQSPGVRTTTYFHVGLDPTSPDRQMSDEERLSLGALRRMVLRTEVSPLDDGEVDDPEGVSLYTVTHNDYVVEVVTSELNTQVLLPRLLRSLEERYERQPDAYAFRSNEHLEYDAFGNVTRQRTRSWRQGQPDADQDVETLSQYAINEGRHCVALPSRVRQQTPAGEVLSATISLYDGAPHEGLPEGQVEAGDLTRTLQLAFSDQQVTSLYGDEPPDLESLGYIRWPGEEGWWISRLSYERGGVAGARTLQVRGARGFDTLLELDGTDQYPKRSTDALGNVLAASANERVFQIASVTDPNGHTTRETFDALGRVVATIRAGDSEELPSVIHRYRTSSLPMRVASEHRLRSGEEETAESYQFYDGAGRRLLDMVAGEGGADERYIVREHRLYTARGWMGCRVIPYAVAEPQHASPPENHPRLELTYDALGRIVEKRNPDGSLIRQRFEPGRILYFDALQAPLDAPSPLVHELDAADRIVAIDKVVDDELLKTRYRYAASGELVETIDPLGAVTRLTWDKLGRLVAEESLDTGRRTFVLDAAGNQVEQRSASGKKARATFDELGRFVAAHVDDEAGPRYSVEYQDGGHVAPDAATNRLSRPFRVRDPLGTTTYAYDANANVTQIRRQIDLLDLPELVTDIEYDALSRKTSLTMPRVEEGGDRRVLRYLYNRRGLPRSIPGFVRNATYDLEGRPTQLEFQNGVRTDVSYHPGSGPIQRVGIERADGSTLRDQVFHYDLLGNLTLLESPRAAEAGSFTYDAMSRLLTASYDNGDDFAYSYGKGGNLESIASLGPLVYRAAGSGAVAEAGGESYSYNVDGHLETAPYGQLHFDALDNLVRIDLADGRRVEQIYDVSGQRVGKLVDGVAELLIAGPELEFHQGEALFWVSFAGMKVVALSTQGQVLYLHPDHQGTPTLFTNSLGEEVRRLAYGPYGTLRHDLGSSSGSDPPPLFLGQPLEVETGLLCLGRRFYDPRLGRFISPDRYVAGAFLLDSWNRYLYAHNNPIRLSDPSGRFSFWDAFAISAMVHVVAGLVVAGFFTFGATWAGAAAVSAGFFSAAAGVTMGSIAGGIAAHGAGQDVWKGVLFGGTVGGHAGFIGGALGAAVTGASNTYLGFIVAGAIQGGIAGAGSGAAIGFAGGAGTVESMLHNVWKGFLIGAIVGALVGAFAKFLQGNDYINIGFDRWEQTPSPASVQTDTLPKAGFNAATAADAGNAARAGVGVGSSLISFSNEPGNWISIGLGQEAGVFLTHGSGLAGTASFFVVTNNFDVWTFDSILMMALEMIPVGGWVFMIARVDDAGWYTDLQGYLNAPFGVPEHRRPSAQS